MSTSSLGLLRNTNNLAPVEHGDFNVYQSNAALREPLGDKQLSRNPNMHMRPTAYLLVR